MKATPVNKGRVLVGLLLISLLSGCIGHIDRTHEGSVSKLQESELDKKLVPGKTTKKEVLLLLGRPDIPADYNHQNMWFYHSNTKGRALYVLVPVNYDETITLVLTFDENKILTHREYKKV
ncbi:outer membrane protein assembly factor BamE domain-containing protein [Enterobacter sp. C4G1]|uniref:outer membrane protein assembly factor BamE domain-containing protein n=1 Tax=Enterobacter sp. C4G1 TaxID=3458724 RepID=UPI004069783F